MPWDESVPSFNTITGVGWEKMRVKDEEERLKKLVNNPNNHCNVLKRCTASTVDHIGKRVTKILGHIFPSGFTSTLNTLKSKVYNLEFKEVKCGTNVFC